MGRLHLWSAFRDSPWRDVIRRALAPRWSADVRPGLHIATPRTPDWRLWLIALATAPRAEDARESAVGCWRRSRPGRPAGSDRDDPSARCVAARRRRGVTPVRFRASHKDVSVSFRARLSVLAADMGPLQMDARRARPKSAMDRATRSVGSALTRHGCREPAAPASVHAGVARPPDRGGRGGLWRDRGHGGPPPARRQASGLAARPVVWRGEDARRGGLPQRARVGHSAQYGHWEEPCGRRVDRRPLPGRADRPERDLLAEIDPRRSSAADPVRRPAERDQALLDNARLDLKRFPWLSVRRTGRSSWTPSVSLGHQLGGTSRRPGPDRSHEVQLVYVASPRPIAAAWASSGGSREHRARHRYGRLWGVIVIVAIYLHDPEESIPTVLERLQRGVRLPVEAYDREYRRKKRRRVSRSTTRSIRAPGTVRLKAQFPTHDYRLFPASSSYAASSSPTASVADRSIQQSPGVRSSTCCGPTAPSDPAGDGRVTDADDVSDRAGPGPSARQGRGRRRERLATVGHRTAQGLVNLSRPFILRPVATTLLMPRCCWRAPSPIACLPVSALPEVDYPDHPGLTPSTGRARTSWPSSVTAPSNAVPRADARLNRDVHELERQLGDHTAVHPEPRLEWHEQEWQAAINSALTLLRRTSRTRPCTAR